AFVSAPFILVLDDYHIIDSAEIDAALSALLDLMPPQMTLVLTSRSDPGFPISRLRARGQLLELRADELRFTGGEVAEFLQQTMGLTLPTEQIAALEERTEGWVAGLQMVALSLQNRAEHELEQFVHNFTGSHRFVLDYLVEETLQQQPEHIRLFLLSTAILNRLCGPLCAAVTEQTESQAILESLERNNLFVVPLDDHRQWYRYHHLFTDVLRVYGRTHLSAQVTELHRRASQWYAQQGSSAEAIRHALVAPDFGLAADLIELAWRSMDRSFQEATWLGWVEALPDEMIRVRPVLSTGYAWALLDTNQFAAAEPRLRDAEQWLAAPSAEMVVADEREFRMLPATIAAARAYLAQALGDMGATKTYVQQALALIPADDHFYRGIPAVTLGLAQWAHGELTSAADSFIEAVTSFLKADNLLFVVSGQAVLADIRLVQGRLHDAAEIYEQALQMITERAEPLLRPLANLHRGLSEIRCEQGDFEAALEHLQRSQEFSEQANELNHNHRLYVAMARLEQAQGNLEG
ncbi:MAG: tetratricopeptide repeat protein, partial [Anaerolineales bacterium]|nr:tetratricopeptide repeat protein [Anaerolineales bacterium]